jgi:hypothetical protein
MEMKIGQIGELFELYYDAWSDIHDLVQVNVTSTEIQLVFKIRNTASDRFIVRIFKSGGISLYDKNWNKYWDMI